MVIYNSVHRATRSRTRKAVLIHRFIEVRWCNHCCSGKAICVTYCKCVFL